METMMDVRDAWRHKAGRIKLLIAAGKFLVLLFLVVGVPLLVYAFNPHVLAYFEDLDTVNELIEQNYLGSAVVFVGIQIVQVVVCFLPGQIVQMAAGYAYSLWFGYLVMIVGFAIGTVLTFAIGRALGRDLVCLLWGEDKMAELSKLINSRKGYAVVFILYLIPGLPKDLFIYAATIGDMDNFTFTAVSLAARTPALIAGMLLGRFFRDGNMAGFWWLCAAILVTMGAGVLFRRQLIGVVDGMIVRRAERLANNGAGGAESDRKNS